SAPALLATPQDRHRYTQRYAVSPAGIEGPGVSGVSFPRSAWECRVGTLCVPAACLAAAWVAAATQSVAGGIPTQSVGTRRVERGNERNERITGNRSPTSRLPCSANPFAIVPPRPYPVSQVLPRASPSSRVPSMLKRCLLVAVLALVVGVLAWATPADRPGGLKPTVFAIRDARVVTEPGKVLPKATVVIRDGLIEAVAADAKVPPEALTMDGKDLTVYAGFIDALSTWGFDPALRRSETGGPAPQDYAGEALAATKADNRKGLTPEFVVGTALRNEDEPADNWRRTGFTAHLVAPDGGIIVGQSALVSLSGAVPRESVLRSPVAMHASFRLPG